MQRFNLSSTAVLFLLLIIDAGAQQKSNVQGYQRQGDANRLKLVFDFGSAAMASQWFGNGASPAARLSNYALFQVLSPNTSQMHLKDVTREYFDDSGTDHLTLDSFSNSIELPLKQPLHSEITYIAELSDPALGRLDATITASPAIIAYDEAALRTKLKITANINLSAALNQPITIKRSFAPGAASTTDSYQSTIVDIQTDGIVLKLERKLPSGKTSPLQLSIQGLHDNYGTAVNIQSKVASVPAAPTDLTKAFVTAQLGAIAAVHSSPTFSAIGAIAPWHPVQRTVVLPGGIFFDPAANFSVGSANAKTSNSVIVPSSFIRPLIVGLPKLKKGEPSPDLNTLKPAKPFVINMMFGPRAEFDTQYGGVNILGEGRAELYLSQLFQTSDVRTSTIATGNPAIRDLLALPQNGFTLAPYIQFDGGGHINSQSITNAGSVPAVNIPTYSIVRLYLGVHGTGQRGKATVNFDGSWVDLFHSEIVPYTVKTTVYSRSLSGFQPYAKATFSFYFDDAKHFAGSIAWENGRSAPTFAYLNKVTIGLQATY
jgi:hypothetical protein